MTPRITMGGGITGAINYARGEGRDPVTRALKKLAPGAQSRVEWYGGGNFGFAIDSEERIELARKVMEFRALNQKGKSRQVVAHLSLSWRPGEKPTRDHMKEQVDSALASIGMANAMHVCYSHGDEHYKHIHVIVLNINPDTGYRYDLKGNYLKLSSWAEAYETEHGGVISLKRANNNELRAAITFRDAAAVLEAMTKQRATFTAAQLDAALAKQIKNESERADFTGQILGHHAVVHLAAKENPDGPVVRYSTRAVIEAEQHVLRAAESLKCETTHGIDERQQAAILESAAFKTMTEEQARAFRHVTGPEGLALIDGQAGTGKSYTIAAVREAYERAGCNVIGLGPTNPVAEDMKGDGFRHAATIHSELFALNNARRSWNAKTVVIVDEAAMIDTKLMAMVTAWAVDSRAKLVLVGDDRQLSSIDAGGMFGVLKDRYGAAALSEVKRQHKLDDRRASEMMAEGNYHDALNIYDGKGAIHWTRTQGEASAQLVAQWSKDSAARPDKTRFVFAYTNDDVATLNAALRAVRKGRGELGDDHELDTAHGRHGFAAGDRIQFTGTDKKQGIHNGRAGTIEAIDGTHLAVRLDGRQAKTINFDAANFDKFRHGYAGTIYKAQGRTLSETYLYHSEHWRSAASYVALTRHRDKTELFVATNTARDIKELSRQMARTDDRRAASMFHHRPEITAPELTAPEMLARFSADMAPRKDQEMQTPPQEQPQKLRFEADGTAALAPDDWSPSRAFIEEAANTNRVEHVAIVTEAPQATAQTPEHAAAVREAWQQPAFSLDTIRADPWTAVYLDAPENASPVLLNAAYNAAARCIEFIDQGIRDYPDAVTAWPAGQSDPENIAAKAEARRDELHAMLFPIGAPAAEQPKRERIAALEDMAVAAAQEMLHATPQPHRPDPAPVVLSVETRSFRTVETEPNRYAELKPAPEIAAESRPTPEAATAPTAPAQATTLSDQPQRAEETLFTVRARPEAISPARGVRFFLERIGDRIAAAYEFLHDVVSPPPRLTAGQIHDRLQASAEGGNLEALDAQAAAEAAAVHDAEKDEQIFRADQQTQQADLSLAQRFGHNATREVHVVERDHERDHGHELE